MSPVSRAASHHVRVRVAQAAGRMVRRGHEVLLVIGMLAAATQCQGAADPRRAFVRGSPEPGLQRRLQLETLRREQSRTYEPVWSLADRAGPLVLPELAHAMASAPELWRELVLIGALGNTHGEDARVPLFERFRQGQTSRPERAVLAALALRSCPPDDKVRDALVQAARNAKAAVRIAALLALESWYHGRVEKIEPVTRPKDPGVAAAEILATGAILPARRLQELLADWKPGTGGDSLRLLALCVVIAERREASLRAPLRELFGALKGEDRTWAAFVLARLETEQAPDQALMGHGDDRVAAAYLAGYGQPARAPFRTALAADAGLSRSAAFRATHHAARARGAPIVDAMALWSSLGKEPEVQLLVGQLVAQRLLAGDPLADPPAWSELLGRPGGGWIAAAAGWRDHGPLLEAQTARDPDAWIQWKALRGDLSPDALAHALAARILPHKVEPEGFLRDMRRRLTLDLFAQGSEWLAARRSAQTPVASPYLPDGLTRGSEDFYRVLESYLMRP